MLENKVLVAGRYGKIRVVEQLQRGRFSNSAMVEAG
jgi:hypothetical protein